MDETAKNYCDSLSQEAGILDRLKSQGLKNPKKLKKLAERLLAEVTLPVQRELLMDILRSRDPIRYLKDCDEQVNDCSAIVKQFLEDGHHGMIMTGHKYRTIYPVTLATPEKWLNADDMWSPDDELDIQYKAAKAWMEEHDVGHFHGKVLLYPQFGFSGMPATITMDRRLDTTGLDKIEGTEFFYDPNIKD